MSSEPRAPRVPARHRLEGLNRQITIASVMLAEALKAVDEAQDVLWRLDEAHSRSEVESARELLERAAVHGAIAAEELDALEHPAPARVVSWGDGASRH